MLMKRFTRQKHRGETESALRFTDKKLKLSVFLPILFITRVQCDIFKPTYFYKGGCYEYKFNRYQ